MVVHKKRRFRLSERIYFVYCHTNKSNNKKYFGITKQRPKDRWDSGHGYRSNRYFWSAIKKYGWSNFEHEIIAENLTEQEAKDMEMQLISDHNTTNREIGYNITFGGESGNGIILSQESRQKISIANKGHPTSQETRDKISKAHKGKIGLRGRDSPNYGRKATEETKRLLSISHSGEKHRLYGKSQPKETRDKIGIAKSIQVVQLDLNGNLIREWKNITSAKEEGFQDSKISSCCKGNRLTHGNYVWMYKTEYEDMSKEQIEDKCNNISKQLSKYFRKQVIQLTIEGKFIKEWDSISSTTKYGFSKGAISNCCKGIQKTHKGFLWKYSCEYYENLKEENDE